MRITLLALPYKVKSMVVGWKGWRYNHWGIVWKEACDCDTEKGCILVAQSRRWAHELGEAYEEEEPCECSSRPPHTHTWAGYLGSRTIGFPKTFLPKNN